MERLRGQMLDQYVAGMSEAIRSMRPEDLAANREMVRDLNELIRERIGGSDPREFLAKRAQFPGRARYDHSPHGWPRCSRSCSMSPDARSSNR